MPAPPPPGPYLSDCLFGACRLELTDFTHAVRHEPRTQQLIRLASAVGVAACVAGTYLMTAADERVGVLLFGVGVLSFAAHNAPDHIAQRWFQKTPRAARDQRYTLNAQGLIVSSEISRRLYTWSTLHGFWQAPDSLLVWVSSQLFIIIPKRAFQTADLPAVVARLEREVGAPAELPRFWSRLLALMALVLVSLWLWNRLSPR